MARFAFASLLALVMSATAARGTTFLVPPGPGTPIQDAIDAAAPGDTIRLTLGAYGEDLVIDKPLKIRGVRSTSVDPNGTTLLNGTCASGPRITVLASSVQLRGIQVVGSAAGGVAIHGRDRVKLTDVFVSAQCSGTYAPAVDVEASTRITLKKVWASGLIQAPIGHPGIRIANTPQEGRVRVQSCIAGGFVAGISLENDGILSVRVAAGYFNYNDRGIYLQNTSRAIVAHNREIIDNNVSGIELDATSSGNVIVRNVVSGSPNDVVDAGTGNCWRNNTYTTGSIPSCP